MNPDYTSAYIEYFDNGQFSDLTIVEQSTLGTTREYKVHWIIMYTGCEYLQKKRDSLMKDSDSNIVVINTKSPKLGILEPILKSIYASTCSTIKKNFTNFVQQGTIDDAMAVHAIVDYLQLPAKYNKYIVDAISHYFDEGKLVKWWREQDDKGLEVPQVIENIIQTYIEKNITYLSNTKKTYISIETLLHLWNDSNDPFATHVSAYLKNLIDLGQYATNNVNNFMESDDESDSFGVD